MLKPRSKFCHEYNVCFSKLPITFFFARNLLYQHDANFQSNGEKSLEIWNFFCGLVLMRNMKVSWLAKPKKKLCYVTRLNCMGVFNAFFLLIHSFPHGKFFFENTCRTHYWHQMFRGKTFIYHGKSVLRNRTCCQSCWMYIVKLQSWCPVRDIRWKTVFVTAGR